MSSTGEATLVAGVRRTAAAAANLFLVAALLSQSPKLRL